jgi:TP901 family phage tail tape measure protein
MAGNRFLLADAFVRKTFGMIRTAAFGAVGAIRSVAASMATLLPIAGALTPILAAALPLFVFARFEQGMANVRAITLDTKESFRELADQARELGGATMFTARQVLDAQENLSQAGLKKPQILTVTPQVLNLAAAAGLTLAEAGDILTTIMGTMGESVSQSGRIVDILANAFSNAKSNVSELGQAFTALGNAGAEAGLSTEDVTAAFQIMSDSGIRGSLAGTQLKTVLGRLTGGTSEVRKAFKRLGTDIDAGGGKFKDIADLLDDMNEGLAKMTPLAAAQVRQLVGGMRGKLGLGALLGAGGDVLRANREQLETNGTAAQQMAIKMDTVIGKLRIWGSALAELGIQIGTFMEPVLSGIIEIGTSITQMISRLGEPAFERLRQGAELVERSMLAIADAIDAITPENFLRIGKDIGTMLWEAFFGVAESVWERIAILAKATLVDTTASILELINKARAGAIARFEDLSLVIFGPLFHGAALFERAFEAAFDPSVRVDPQALAEELRNVTGLLLTPLTTDEAGVQKLRDFADEQRRVLSEMRPLSEEIADKLSTAADKLTAATAPDRIEAMGNKLEDLAKKLRGEMLGPETSQARINVLNAALEAIDSQTDRLVALHEEVKRTGIISPEGLRILQDQTDKLAGELEALLGADPSKIRKEEDSIAEATEEAAKQFGQQFGQSQAIAASALQAHFQGLTQIDKQIKEAIEQGNELQDEGNDILDDIADNTANMVPGGWLPGNAVGGFTA